MTGDFGAMVDTLYY